VSRVPVVSRVPECSAGRRIGNRTFNCVVLSWPCRFFCCFGEEFLDKHAQQVLEFARMRSSVADRITEHDHRNLRAARIILAERERYERECRLLVRWAELVIWRFGAA